MFSNFTNVQGYEVELKEGEVLYIPPFWWHQITTSPESHALSLSVVSPSWEEAVLAKAFWTPVPFKNFTSSVERKVAAQMLLVHVISRVPSLGSPQLFANFVFEARWQSLYEDFEFGGEGEGQGEGQGQGQGQGQGCFAEEELEEVEKIRGAIFDSDGDELFVEAAEGIANILNDELLLNGIRMVFMADYVESLAQFAVGMGGMGGKDEHDNEIGAGVVGFIANCLNYDAIDIVQEFDEDTILVENGDRDRENESENGYRDL